MTSETTAGPPRWRSHPTAGASSRATRTAVSGPGTCPAAGQRPRVPPRRGQIAGLSVSADGRYLLQISQDRQAQVWDLQDGRGSDAHRRALDLGRALSRWRRASISPTTDDGDVVAVDRTSGRPPVAAVRPVPRRGRRSASARLTVCAATAAGSRPGAPRARSPASGTPRPAGSCRRSAGHRDPHPITAVEFSADAQAAPDRQRGRHRPALGPRRDAGPARARAGHLHVDRRPAVEPVPVTAARASRPMPPLRVVTGGIDGQVVLWEGRTSGPPLDAGAHGLCRPGRDVHSRRPLAGRDRGRQVGLALGPGRAPRPRRVRLEPLPAPRRAGQRPARLAGRQDHRQRERRHHDPVLEPGNAARCWARSRPSRGPPTGWPTPPTDSSTARSAASGR